MAWDETTQELYYTEYTSLRFGKDNLMRTVMSSVPFVNPWTMIRTFAYDPVSSTTDGSTPNVVFSVTSATVKWKSSSVLRTRTAPRPSRPFHGPFEGQLASQTGLVSPRHVSLDLDTGDLFVVDSPVCLPLNRMKLKGQVRGEQRRRQLGGAPSPTRRSSPPSNDE